LDMVEMTSAHVLGQTGPDLRQEVT
jgi:hypothetical protein